MCAKIVVSRMLMLRCLWLTLGLCIWLGTAPAGAVPTMEWNGNQTVTGNQTVSGGLNVGTATDAATAQVKMQSSSGSSLSVAWQSTYGAGSAGPSVCSSAVGTGWLPSDEELGGLPGNLSVSEDGAYAYSAYGSTNPLNAYSFGFSIPTNATVTGVEVSYRIQGQDSGRWARFQLTSGGTPIGSYKAIAMPTSWASGTLGSAGDVWGASLTPTTINDGGFGVQTWMANPAGPIYYMVDYISVKIYYTTGGQWMAGGWGADGSWRLANTVTSLNLNTRLLMKANTGYLRIGNGTAPSYPLQMAGTAYCTGNVWVDNSSRSHKLNISPVPAVSAWELLDLLQPVDFEYRKMETQFKLKDGSVVRELPADPNEVAEEVTVWTDEGSGECHRGFIAEDVPAPLTRGDGIAALDIAANNTAALQEAKRRIMELERQMAALTPVGAAVGGVAGSGVGDSGAPAVGTAGSGSSGVSDLSDPSNPSDETIQRLTEAVLKKIGVDPWIEVPLAEAWEEVDETAPVSAPQTVTRYRVNLDTMQVEAYTVEETVTQQQPTGRKVKQLKGDVRFGEKTGKFYRWCGLGGATPAQTSAALLGKLLPGLVAVSSGRAGNAAVSFPSSLKPQASSLFSHSWNTGRARP